MSLPSNTACFDTVDAVSIDGANAVCIRPSPQTHAIAPVTMVLLGGVLVMAVVLFALPRRRTVARRALGTVSILVALALALPGLYAVWIRRPDAPSRLGESARAMDGFVRAVDRFSARYDGCVDVVNRGCVACEPALRYARPTVRPCVTPRAQVLVGDGALTAGCVERGATLRCGAVP